jgi:hypothetical protein
VIFAVFGVKKAGILERMFTSDVLS